MVEHIPSWLKPVIDRSGIERIEEAVRSAETKTSGEIVPLVVRRSTSIGLLPVVTASFAVLIPLVIQLEGLTPLEKSAWVWMVIYTLAAALGYGAAFLPFLQRWLLPAEDQKNSVEQRALLEFYAARLDHTERGTGILLFVSLVERRAVVLADKGIAQHCKTEVFDEVVADLIRGAKSGDLASGFVAAVARSAKLLTPYFPPLVADKNELKDYLRIKE